MSVFNALYGKPLRRGAFKSNRKFQTLENFYVEDDDSDRSDYSHHFGGHRNRNARAGNRSLRPESPEPPNPPITTTPFSEASYDETIYPIARESLDATTPIVFPFPQTPLQAAFSAPQNIEIDFTTGGSFWSDPDPPPFSAALDEIARIIDGDKTTKLDIFNGAKQPFVSFDILFDTPQLFHNITFIIGTSDTRRAEVGLSIILYAEDSILRTIPITPSILVDPDIDGVDKTSSYRYGIDTNLDPLTFGVTKIGFVNFSNGPQGIVQVLLNT